MSRDHRKLDAFTLSDAFVVDACRVTAELPDHERYGLTSQIRRAAVSVPANIVEGCARPTEADFRHFLSIAHGSLREAGYLLDLAHRLGYICEQSAGEIAERYEQASRTLAGLIRSLR